MRPKLILCLSVICILAAASAYPDVRQDLRIPEPGKLQMITLNDGSTLIGRITSASDNEIEFETDLGVMTIAISKIKGIKEIDSSSMIKGEYWFPNPNETRMFIGPTGRTLKAGSGYFLDVYIFFPSVAYGITDNITIGGGASIFPGVSASNQLMYGNLKIGAEVAENLNLAASGLIIRLPDLDSDDDDVEVDDTEFVGVLFGVATYGTSNKSITGGLGYGYSDKDVSDPSVLIGGEYRLARRLSLVTENWIFPSVDDPLISLGVRFFGEGMSVDLAFFTSTATNAITLPYIDFVWNF